jgi:hypothetical protein
MDWTQGILKRHKVDTMFEKWLTTSKVETDRHTSTHKIHDAVKSSLLLFLNKSGPKMRAGIQNNCSVQMLWQNTLHISEKS